MRERSWTRGSFGEAAFLGLVGLGVLFDARGYPEPLTAGTPGPAFFPRLLAILLIWCAAALLFRRERTSPTPGSRGWRLWGAAFGIAGFLGLLPLVGALFALPPLVAGLMWLAGERSPVVLVAVPLAFAGFVHLLFRMTLGVPLP